jgi:hypothetical protein
MKSPEKKNQTRSIKKKPKRSSRKISGNRIIIPAQEVTGSQNTQITGDPGTALFSRSCAVTRIRRTFTSQLRVLARIFFSDVKKIDPGPLRARK